jgi:hypothetical protein
MRLFHLSLFLRNCLCPSDFTTKAPFSSNSAKCLTKIIFLYLITLNKNRNALFDAILSIFLFLINMPLSTILGTFSDHDLLSMVVTMFRTHTKQNVKLKFCEYSSLPFLAGRRETILK